MARIIDDKELIEAINIYGAEVIAELTKQLLKADKKASGNLIKSLDHKVVKVIDNITLQILSEDYLQYVDRGRKPGSFPPVQAIAKWCTLRGIPKSAAWPISYKIFKFGIKPTNVMQKTLSALERSRASKNLEDNLTDWVDEAVNDLFINLSKNNNFVFRQ